MTQAKKKGEPATWRHYNFTTAGPVDDYLYSMLPKRDEVLAEMEDYASEHRLELRFGIQVDRIERSQYDVFTRRISLSTAQKSWIVARAASRAWGLTS